jgi:hypothetical protein
MQNAVYAGYYGIWECNMQAVLLAPLYILSSCMLLLTLTRVMLKIYRFTDAQCTQIYTSSNLIFWGCGFKVKILA